MHYRNGREAKIGDEVLCLPSYGFPAVGVLVSATPGSSSCNGQLTSPFWSCWQCITIGECLHMDDVRAAITAATPEAQPAGS